MWKLWGEKNCGKCKLRGTKCGMWKFVGKNNVESENYGVLIYPPPQ